jgi:DNA polymerase (family 10)
LENARIAEVFEEMGDLLELKDGNAFKIRSYRSAAQTIRGLSERLADRAKAGDDLTDIPNIGKSLADKIHEILETGTCSKVEKLRDDFPVGLPELMNVPGLGPRKVKLLYEALDITSLADLRKACKEHKVAELEGMGEKTEENILKGLDTVEATEGRLLLKETAEFVETLSRALDHIDEVKRWEVAGSFRRRKETIGDLDILIEAGDREKARDDIVGFDDIQDVVNKGTEKISVTLKSGLQVDFRFFEKDAFGPALLYFTGSKSHNIALRKVAQKEDWKLNEYGLYSGEKRLAGKSEEETYDRLGYPYIEPELREDRGELKAAKDDKLPDLVTLDAIQGDLHAHTKATDGTQTIEEMAGAAQERGYKYLAITDHSKAVRMVNGLDEDELREHADAIRRVDDDLDRFWLLAGVEVDILKGGALDLADDVLTELDWVCASVHSYFDLDEKEMTKRLVKAVESGVIHCIGHPLGRMIGQRDPAAVDSETLFQACAEHNVYLEINAQPQRLDLPDTYCRAAADAGVKFVIGTDAHKDTDLDLMWCGVAVARRGWLSADQVLNTSNLTYFRKQLGGR